MARTFFREASVFILDEPTASLDSISENKLFKYIKNDYIKTIYIFITHNLKNLSFARKIIYIQNDGSVLFDDFESFKETSKNFKKFIQGVKLS